MIDYTGLTDEQAHAQRMADRGSDWIACDMSEQYADSEEEEQLADIARQALHDRDRFQRDAAYWREECINLTWEALS